MLVQRLRLQRAHVCGERRPSSVVALLHGNETSSRSCHQESGETNRAVAEASDCAAFLACVAVGSVLALIEECPLCGGDVRVMFARPLQGRDQPRPAVELGLVAAAFLPLPGGGAEVRAQRPAGFVFLQPAA